MLGKDALSQALGNMLPAKTIADSTDLPAVDSIILCDEIVGSGVIANSSNILFSEPSQSVSLATELTLSRNLIRHVVLLSSPPKVARVDAFRVIARVEGTDLLSGSRGSQEQRHAMSKLHATLEGNSTVASSLTEGKRPFPTTLRLVPSLDLFLKPHKKRAIRVLSDNIRVAVSHPASVMHFAPSTTVRRSIATKDRAGGLGFLWVNFSHRFLQSGSVTGQDVSASLPSNYTLLGVGA